MSGIEALGLLASVSQLVVYGLKIATCLSEICQRARDTSLRIAQHSGQIGQLVIIVQYIENQVGNHQYLRTAHLRAQIDATLEQAKSLSATLEQLRNDYSRGTIRKYWKTIQGGKEKEILANFDRLEKEKSSLLLCISVVHMDLLGNIQESHKGLRDSAEEERVEVDETSTSRDADKEARTTPEERHRQGAARTNAFDRGMEVPLGQARREAHPNTSRQSQECPTRETHHIPFPKEVDGTSTGRHADKEARTTPEERHRQGAARTNAFDREMEVPLGQARREAHPKISRRHRTSRQSQEHPTKETDHVYDNVVVAMTARCINGDALSDPANPSARHLPKHLYKNIRAEGLSDVLNGNVDSIEGLKAFFSPRHLASVHEVTLRGTVYDVKQAN